MTIASVLAVSKFKLGRPFLNGASLNIALSICFLTLIMLL